MTPSLVLCISLGACIPSAPPLPEPSPLTKPVEITPTTALADLVNAQDNFFSLTGRFSMTLDPLVTHGFLERVVADVLQNKTAQPGWHFEVVKLPFPDEDVSWCRVARGPENIILLGAITGVWERHDGQLPLERDTLPPAAPWKRSRGR